MQVRTTRSVMIRMILYSLMPFLVYALQTAPGFFHAGGLGIVYLVPYAVCTAAMGRMGAAGYTGILCGLLWDLSGSRLFGFHALVLYICCTVISILFTDAIQERFVNVLLACFVSILVCEGVALIYDIAVFKGGGVSWHAGKITAMLLTLLMTVPFYAVMKWFHKRF